MAKKIKFPLAMKNDVLVKDLNELRENFDLDKAVGYFLDGKLLRWLEARYYDTEAEAIKNLNLNAPDFKQQLCKIFNVDCPDISNTDTDFNAVAEHSRKLTALKQYTSDSNLLAKVDSVAFNQEDLADLLDENVHDIYLCNNSFVIPLRAENKRYIGIGKVEAIIRSNKRIDFKSLRIEFENINFDPVYAKLNEQTAEELYDLGQAAESEQNYGIAFSYYQKSANLGYIEAMFALAKCYMDGHGVKENAVSSVKWLRKIIKFDKYRDRVIYEMGNLYKGSKREKIHNMDKAMECYQKAAELGNTEAMVSLGKHYYEKDISKTIEWYEKAAVHDKNCAWWLGAYYNGKDNRKAVEWFEKAWGVFGDKSVLWWLGNIYEQGGYGVSINPSKAVEWYEKAAELGDTTAMKSLGWMYISGELVQADYFKGIEYLEKGLKDSDFDRCNQLYLYLRKDHTRFNEFDRIFAQEEKSAINGNHWAMARLGYLFEWGVSYLENHSIHWAVKEDLDKAVEWYEKAANLGNLWALYNLMDIFRGVDDKWLKYRDLKKAVKWLEKYLNISPKLNNYQSFESWHGSIVGYLCNVLMTGSDTLPKDVDKVVEWCEKYSDDYLFVKYDWREFLLQ